jgi:hypothetical protein
MKESFQLRRRIERLDWERIEEALNEAGYATTPPLLSGAQCASLVSLYPERERFRKKVDMTRLRFGVGEYQYFAAPLPPVVEALRASFYPHLAAIANRWRRALDESSAPLASDLAGFLRYCADHGQTKPTPLMLRYETGGYNCMHQDIYGEVLFPLQITIVLSRRGADYSGGEFLLLEDRPRSQSRCSAVTLELGEGIIFPASFRPIGGVRGYYRARMRHGLSPLRGGVRYALGIIFHNAT